MLAKRRALADVQTGRAAHDLRVACDLWCAAFFAPRAARPEMRGRELVPTTDTVWRYLRAPSSVYGPLVGAVGGIARAAALLSLAAGVSGGCRGGGL